MNPNEIVTKAFIANEIFAVDPGSSNGGIVKFNGERYESWALSKIKDFEDLVKFWKYQAEICKLPLITLEMITTFNPDASNIGRMHRLNKLKNHYVELKSAIKLSKIQYIEVMPSSWQKYLQIHIDGEDYEIRKKRYKDISRDWFPGYNITGWNADAFLMIEFTRKKLKYDQRWILSKLAQKPTTKSLF